MVTTFVKCFKHKNSTFYPHNIYIYKYIYIHIYVCMCVCMCTVWLSRWSAIIFLNNTNRLDFVMEMGCVPWGRHWIFRGFYIMCSLYLLGTSICRHVGLFVSWIDGPTWPWPHQWRGFEITYIRTHHTRYESSGGGIGPSQRPLPDNTNIHER
jgi:hypothetical protein